MADNVDNGNNRLQTCMAFCQVVIAVAVIVAGGCSIKIDCETERRFDFSTFFSWLLYFTALKLESILQCNSDGSCSEEYAYISARQVFLGQ